MAEAEAEAEATNDTDDRRPSIDGVIIFRLVRKTSKPPIMWKKKIITERERERERELRGEGGRKRNRMIPLFPGIGASSSNECNAISLSDHNKIGYIGNSS